MNNDRYAGQDCDSCGIGKPIKAAGLGFYSENDNVAEGALDWGVIKTCPCCKGKKVGVERTPEPKSTNTETTGFYVECYKCGLRTAAWSTLIKAVSKWNKRAS